MLLDGTQLHERFVPLRRYCFFLFRKLPRGRLDVGDPSFQFLQHGSKVQGGGGIHILTVNCSCKEGARGLGGQAQAFAGVEVSLRAEAQALVGVEVSLRAETQALG